MNRITLKIWWALTLTLSLCGTNVTAQNKHSTKNPHDNHVGNLIHESVIDGYHFAYHTLKLPRNKRHLTLHIFSPQNKSILKAEVGFIIKGPGRKTQKMIAVLMKDTYGRDVDFSVKGKYTIKVMIIMGRKKMMDTFEYEVK